MTSRIYTSRFSIARVERDAESVGKNVRLVVYVGTNLWMAE
jgi:hypothetical protein